MDVLKTSSTSEVSAASEGSHASNESRLDSIPWPFPGVIWQALVLIFGLAALFAFRGIGPNFYAENGTLENLQTVLLLIATLSCLVAAKRNDHIIWRCLLLSIAGVACLGTVRELPKPESLRLEMAARANANSNEVLPAVPSIALPQPVKYVSSFLAFSLVAFSQWRLMKRYRWGVFYFFHPRFFYPAIVAAALLMTSAVCERLSVVWLEEWVEVGVYAMMTVTGLNFLLRPGQPRGLLEVTSDESVEQPAVRMAA
ncbi:MAG: hypothetical protein AAF664_08065 [Planctomycetota bacterium]